MTDNPQYSEARPESQPIEFGAFLNVDAYIVDKVFPKLSVTEIVLYKMLRFKYEEGKAWGGDASKQAESLGFHRSTLIRALCTLQKYRLITLDADRDGYELIIMVNEPPSGIDLQQALSRR